MSALRWAFLGLILCLFVVPAASKVQQLADVAHEVQGLADELQQTDAEHDGPDQMIRIANLLLKVDPKNDGAYVLRAGAYASKEDYPHALADYDAALQSNPEDTAAFTGRGKVLAAMGEYHRAVADFEQALEAEDLQAATALAWLRATCPVAAERDGSKAIELATRACKAAHGRDPNALDALAAAYAETGAFDKAVERQKEALVHADYFEPKTRAALEARLKLYQSKKPFRTEEAKKSPKAEAK
jgi:tetratricopeptide (TPR) repeat protein